jgi:hypothetical protein
MYVLYRVVEDGGDASACGVLDSSHKFGLRGQRRARDEQGALDAIVCQCLAEVVDATRAVMHISYGQKLENTASCCFHRQVLSGKQNRSRP